MDSYRLPVLPRDEAQQRVMNEYVYPYLATPEPGYMLVLGLPPGFGKTHLMTKLLSERAEEGFTAFYAGSRRDMFATLMREVEKVGGDPAHWKEWLPQQDERHIEGGRTTCVHPVAALNWLKRGNRLFEFCKNVCGIEYIMQECGYYLQSRSPTPIIYGHHNHVWLGNSLLNQKGFDLLVGDEEPLNAVLWEWAIPPQWVCPKSLSENHPFYAACRALQAAIERDEDLRGITLLNEIGGLQRVTEQIKEYRKWKEREQAVLPFWTPEKAPQEFNYFDRLADILEQECDAVLDYDNYVERIAILPTTYGRSLRLLLRREPSPHLPKHIIWCDATPDEEIYRTMFRRDVRVIRADVPRKGKVYQVTTRLNNKTSLLKFDNPTPKYTQVVEHVNRVVRERGYKTWAVATFKAGERLFDTPLRMHFGGNRGRNEWRDEDPPQAVFVVGTPMPTIFSIEDIAAMLWQKRSEGFIAEWERRNGKSGFWKDDALARVLHLKRESEIYQTAHRSGMNNRDVDVYLFTNLPIDELQPDETFTLSEMFDAPQGVNVSLWVRILDAADRLVSEFGYVSVRDLAREGKISIPSSQKYVRYLIDRYGWQEIRAISNKRVVGAGAGWSSIDGMSAAEYDALRGLPLITPEIVTKRLNCDMLTARKYILALTKQGYTYVLVARQNKKSPQTFKV